eukprot:GHVN01001605.1.p1 GENE.GHVN01001605.1~~GHVN01001605.1.p1  ORF type:complete len:1426 (-),score=185.78 GHVN01001605.1:3584-7861(-)
MRRCYPPLYLIALLCVVIGPSLNFRLLNIAQGAETNQTPQGALLGSRWGPLKEEPIANGISSITGKINDMFSDVPRRILVSYRLIDNSFIMQAVSHFSSGLSQNNGSQGQDGSGMPRAASDVLVQTRNRVIARLVQRIDKLSHVAHDAIQQHVSAIVSVFHPATITEVTGNLLGSLGFNLPPSKIGDDFLFNATHSSPFLKEAGPKLLADLANSLLPLPFKSVYLPSLHMEIFETPAWLPVLDFLDVLRTDEDIEGVWNDEVISEEEEPDGARSSTLIDPDIGKGDSHPQSLGESRSNGRHLAGEEPSTVASGDSHSPWGFSGVQQPGRGGFKQEMAFSNFNYLSFLASQHPNVILPEQQGSGEPSDSARQPQSRHKEHVPANQSQGGSAQIGSGPTTSGDISIIPNDPLFSQQWAHVDVSGFGANAPLVWDVSDVEKGSEPGSSSPEWRKAEEATGNKSSKKFIVALIDSGVDYVHHDLRENIWRNEKEVCGNGIDDDGNGYIDDCLGWNFVDENNDPMDDNGHGTASAGIIAASGNNGYGVSPMCWNCEVMVLKALNKDIKGTISGFVRALDYALTQGVRLSNNSYGGRGSSFGALKDAVRRAQRKGMIFVAAAGNYKTNNDNDRSPTYPASYNLDNMISVAAVTRDGKLASFSSYGASTVHVGAPGDQILTTQPHDGFKLVDGTSFAVPFVSSAVALIWSQQPHLNYSQVIERIMSNVKPSPDLTDKLISGGTLDVFAAMTNGGQHEINDVNFRSRRGGDGSKVREGNAGSADLKRPNQSEDENIEEQDATNSDGGTKRKQQKQKSLKADTRQSGTPNRVGASIEEEMASPSVYDSPAQSKSEPIVINLNDGKDESNSGVVVIGNRCAKSNPCHRAAACFDVEIHRGVNRGLPGDTSESESNYLVKFITTDSGDVIDRIVSRLDVSLLDMGLNDATDNQVLVGVECECKAGYQGDGLMCADIDECSHSKGESVPRVCGFNKCINTDGSYQCECHAGFVLSADKSNCERVLDVCGFNDGSSIESDLLLILHQESARRAGRGGATCPPAAACVDLSVFLGGVMALSSIPMPLWPIKLNLSGDASLSSGGSFDYGQNQFFGYEKNRQNEDNRAKRTGAKGRQQLNDDEGWPNLPSSPLSVESPGLSEKRSSREFGSGESMNGQSDVIIVGSLFDCRCPVGYAWNSKTGVGAAKCLKINTPTAGPCVDNGACGLNTLCKATGMFWFQTTSCDCIPGYVRHAVDDTICVRPGFEYVEIDDYTRYSTQHDEATLLQFDGSLGQPQSAPIAPDPNEFWVQANTEATPIRSLPTSFNSFSNQIGAVGPAPTPMLTAFSASTSKSQSLPCDDQSAHSSCIKSDPGKDDVVVLGWRRHVSSDGDRDRIIENVSMSLMIPSSHYPLPSRPENEVRISPRKEVDYRSSSLSKFV